MPKKPKRDRIEEKMGWKIHFCTRLASILWMVEQNKEGRRLVFIHKVQGSLEAHINIIFGYIWNARAYTKHPDFSPSPTVEILYSLLCGALYTRYEWTLIPSQPGKEGTYYWREKFWRVITDSCKQQYEFLFFLRKQILADLNTLVTFFLN